MYSVISQNCMFFIFTRHICVLFFHVMTVFFGLSIPPFFTPPQVKSVLRALYISVWGFPSGSVVKNPPASARDTGLIGEGNGSCSSVLAWEIPWTEEPGGLQSMGLQKRHHLATKQQTNKNNSVSVY